MHCPMHVQAERLCPWDWQPLSRQPLYNIMAGYNLYSKNCSYNINLRPHTSNFIFSWAQWSTKTSNLVLLQGHLEGIILNFYFGRGVQHQEHREPDEWPENWIFQQNFALWQVFQPVAHGLHHVTNSHPTHKAKKKIRECYMQRKKIC